MRLPSVLSFRLNTRTDDDEHTPLFDPDDHSRFGMFEENPGDEDEHPSALRRSSPESLQHPTSSNATPKRPTQLHMVSHTSIQQRNCATPTSPLADGLSTPTRTLGLSPMSNLTPTETGRRRPNSESLPRTLHSRSRSHPKKLE